MAYVDIPKDLDGIKNKIAFGLTKRQLIGFGVAATIGIPVYLTTRMAVGNDLGLIFMIATMALPLLYAIYEPKGMTVEQVAIGWLRFHFVSKGARPYQTVNLYEVLERKRREVAATDGNLSKKTGNAKKGTNKIPAKTGR